VGSPSVGLMGILGGFLQAEVSLLGADRRFLDTSLLRQNSAQTCALFFFFDQLAWSTGGSMGAHAYSEAGLSGARFFEFGRLSAEASSLLWSHH
jgi:hypothetical protein